MQKFALEVQIQERHDDGREKGDDARPDAVTGRNREVPADQAGSDHREAYQAGQDAGFGASREFSRRGPESGIESPVDADDDPHANRRHDAGCAPRHGIPGNVVEDGSDRKQDKSEPQGLEQLVADQSCPAGLSGNTFRFFAHVCLLSCLLKGTFSNRER